MSSLPIALKLIFSFSVFFAAGWGVLNNLPSSCQERPLYLRIALAFLLGMGTVPYGMLLLGLAGIPFSVVTISIVSFLPAIVCFLRKRPSPCKAVFKKASFSEALLAILVVFQVMFFGIINFTTPLSAGDSIGIWFLKAKAFYMDRGMASFLTDSLKGYSNLDYPLLLPLSISWIYSCIGKVDEILGRAEYPVMFTCMLSCLYYYFRRLSERRTALAVTLFSTAIPPIVSLSLVVCGGYADLPFMIYFTAAIVFFAVWLSGEQMHDLLLATLFFSFAASTKNEGFPLLVSFFIFLGIRLACMRGGGKWQKLGTMLVALIMSAIIVVPWLFYRRTHNIHSVMLPESAAAMMIAQAIERVPVIIRGVMKEIFFFAKWHLIWVSFLVVIIAQAKRILLSPLKYCVGIVAFQTVSYFFVYLITPFDISWHLATSLDRILLQLSVPCFFLAFAALMPKEDSKAEVSPDE